MNVKHVNVLEQMCLCLYAHVYSRYPPIVWSHLTSTTVLGQTHGNLCQCQLRALEPLYIYIYIKDHLGEMFWSTITFDLSWSAFFYGSADFLICPKGSVSYLCLKQSAVSFRCAQLTIWNLIGNRAYKYQTCNYWKYCSVLGLSQGGGGCRKLLESHEVPLKSSMRVCESSSLTRTYLCIDWRLSHHEKIMPVSVVCMRRKCFLPASRIRAEMIRRTGSSVLFCTV